MHHTLINQPVRKTTRPTYTKLYDATLYYTSIITAIHSVPRKLKFHLPEFYPFKPPAN